MSELTLDDYRKVLAWCGWTNKTFSDGSSTAHWTRDGEEILVFQECALERTSLLLLDYSVLERVRGMGFSRRQQFEDALHGLWQDRSRLDSRAAFGSLFVAISAPGDYTRAAIAVGLVEPKEEKRDG